MYKTLQKETRVNTAEGDQCQYGHETKSFVLGRKRTRWMANSSRVFQEVDKKRQGRRGRCSRPQPGSHNICSAEVARMAAMYSEL